MKLLLLDISQTVSESPLPYPTEFIASASFTNVPATVAQNHVVDHEKLLRLPDTGTIYFPVSHTTGYEIPLCHPPHLFIRFHNMVSKATCQKLVNAYDAVTTVPHAKTNDSKRSTIPAHHFGAWEIYASVPRISAASRPKKAEHVKAIDGFTAVISSFLSRKLAALLQVHDPTQWETLNR